MLAARIPTTFAPERFEPPHLASIAFAHSQDLREIAADVDGRQPEAVAGARAG
jgi:hypothetical protein